MVRAAGWRRGQVGGHQDRDGQRLPLPDLPKVQFDKVIIIKKVGIKDITCFSFGKKGNYEPENAKKIADHLGLKWIFTPTTKKLNRYYYHTKLYSNLPVSYKNIIDHAT